MSLEEFAIRNASRKLKLPIFNTKKEFGEYLFEFQCPNPIVRREGKKFFFNSTLRDSELQEAIDCENEIRFSVKELLSEARGFVPDGWAFKPHKDSLPNSLFRGTICLIEIEDTSKIKIEKLNLLAEFWFYVDCEQMFLDCYCFDRYGKKFTKLTDEDFWEHFAYTKQEKKLSNNQTKNMGVKNGECSNANVSGELSVGI